MLYLFIRHSYSRLAFIHQSYSFMRHFCSCVALIYMLHSPMRCTYLCVAFIHLLHSFYASHSFNDASHLFICCIHLYITLSMYYITSLFSRISHAACSLLTSFFSLIYIKSQTFWQECSTTTIKLSTQAEIHEIHCWPTPLLFSLVLDSLNIYSYQSIFHRSRLVFWRFWAVSSKMALLLTIIALSVDLIIPLLFTLSGVVPCG